LIGCTGDAAVDVATRVAGGVDGTALDDDEEEEEEEAYVLAWTATTLRSTLLFVLSCGGGKLSLEADGLSWLCGDHM
jgi:hypothetical protein